MTNSIAVGIVAAVLLLLGLSLAVGSDAPLFLARKLAALVEWLAFWR